MATVDFKSLLNRPTDTIEKPKPLPEGQYYGLIAAHTLKESKEKHTPYVAYAIKLSHAHESVDTDLLGEIDVSKKQFSKNYFLTEDAMYRLVEFAQSFGEDTDGKTLADVIVMPLQKMVIVTVTQRNSADGTEIYNDIGDVVPA